MIDSLQHTLGLKCFGLSSHNNMYADVSIYKLRWCVEQTLKFQNITVILYQLA